MYRREWAMLSFFKIDSIYWVQQHTAIDQVTTKGARKVGSTDMSRKNLS